MSTLAVQPDIYQRYSVLSVLIAAIRDAADAPAEVTVLDLGCGPQHLTAEFVGDVVPIIRADVDTFGDPSVVQISPDSPLPFADGSVPVVVAIDVLEHIPAALRQAFIREGRRVAGTAFIVCHPQGLPQVRRAEAEFQDFARRVAGVANVPFLAEHEAFGLPEPQDVAAEFSSLWPHVVNVANAPLADWIVYNAIDLAYSCEFGDAPEKHGFDESVNRQLALTGPSPDCYRLFTIGTASERIAESLRAAIDGMASAPRSTQIDDARLLSRAVERLVLDLRRRRLADIQQEHDANQRHIHNLDAALRGWQEAAGLKDGRIASLLQQLGPIAQPEPVHVAGGTRAGLRGHVQSAARMPRHLLARGQRLLHAQRLPPLTWAARASRRTALVQQSGLFDPDFVRAAVSSRRDPLKHFLSCRGRHAPQPHPLFDVGYYVARNPGAATVNPLVHWLESRPGAAASPHPLFDSSYYLESNPDVRASGVNPLSHYLQHGAAEGRRPHPLFDGAFYLARNQDVRESGMNPLVHYVVAGASEGRQPHPLFDARYYVENNPDVRASGVNPLVHYLLHGAAERRRPHPLIDVSDYLARNPDLADRGVNPLTHYVVHGAAEGRRLTLLFDVPFYRARYPDVIQAGHDPLQHYLSSGENEGRWPNAYFDPVFYRRRNPHLDQAASGPLAHYVLVGASEEQPTSPLFDTARYCMEHPEVAGSGVNPLLHHLLAGGGPQGAAAVRGHTTFVPPSGLLPWFNPLNVVVDDGPGNAPAVNVLLPGLGARHMSGGPNTAIQIACRLAASGVRTRLVATDAPLDDDVAPLWAHIARLAGTSGRPERLEVADAHDRSEPFVIGRNDLFVATAWWTAQMAKYACQQTRHSRFIYLIQDYEPLLHAASTPQALAEETYGLDYVPVVNSSSLLAYLVEHGVGRFRDPAFAAGALVFEPAVDRTRFHPEPARTTRPRRLLFYTRPSQGLRNLFELGVAALMKAVASGVFDDGSWELLGIGEAFAPVALGRGLTLVPAPWLDFDAYATQMRQSDVLLSLMLSPHPSYPPLEMAACGGRVVTTAFGTKTAERLSQVSPRIIGTAATIEGVAGGLERAVEDLRGRGRSEAGKVALPATWDESLQPVMQGLRTALLDWWDVPQAARPLERRAWPAGPYEVARLDALATRHELHLAPAPPGLLSFVTAAWNTEPAMLRELAASVLADAAAGAYEWVVLDNGSTSDKTIAVLEELGRAPAVRVVRSDCNLGIVAGMRRLLELARHRYVAFVDHDDLVAYDCARVLGDAICKAGYPALLYTDEDKQHHGTYTSAYYKPSWDPVLFANSCYTAHLSVVDRERALALGACADEAAEGSPDWDTFTRFVLAGDVPVHVPHVLYTWRVHEGSTAGQLAAKPYVVDSQRTVLRRFLDGRPAGSMFEVAQSPLFGSPGEWWLRRSSVHALPSITSVVVADADATETLPALPGSLDHEIVRVDPNSWLDSLATVAERCEAGGRLLHLFWNGLQVRDDTWAWEAAGLFELYPDTVMVGGRVHRDGWVVSAGEYFGMNGACGSPDVGRAVDDAGYFSQHLKPHSTSAVGPWHAVVRPELMLPVLRGLSGLAVPYSVMGLWLGAHARRIGRRVIYSPMLDAALPAGVTVPLDTAARTFFASVNRDLMPDSDLLPANVGSVDPAYAPLYTGGASAADAPSYEAWLDARIRVRAAGLVAATAPPLSLLTGVYEGTDGGLFAATAESIVPQLASGDEWIVLAHGPITPATKQVLEAVSARPCVRVLHEIHNLGITGGMRVCLDAARGEYVVPVDADDLLAQDALGLIRETAVRAGPVLVYSDEDFLVAGRPTHPYARPDFDPVLALESSWAWHLCAFDRAAALEAGVYSDPGAEYCHDWDTLLRLVKTGRPIYHLREVLYHWRQHAGSHTNSAHVHPGSQNSVLHVLERVRASRPAPEAYEVQPFPRFRGRDEPYLARKRQAAPRAEWCVVGDSPSSDPAEHREDFLFRAIHRLPAARGLVGAVRLAVGSTDADVIAFSDATAVPTNGWMWEAVRLLELHPSTAIVSGRVLGPGGVVLTSCGVLDPEGRRREEGVHEPESDAGPFALHFKPHQVHFACDVLFVVEGRWLRSVLDDVPPSLAWGDLACWLSAAAWRCGRSVVYSPLIEAVVRASTLAAPRGEVLRRAEFVARRATGDRLMGTAALAALRSLVH